MKAVDDVNDSSMKMNFCLVGAIVAIFKSFFLSGKVISGYFIENMITPYDGLCIDKGW